MNSFLSRAKYSKTYLRFFGATCLTIGFVLGVYFTLTKLVFPSIFAVNDSTKTWTFDAAGAGDYTYDSSLITVDDSGARPADNKFTNPALNTNLDSWDSELATPSGFVQVPGSDTYSTDDFFVMEYEAKCAATPDPTTGLTSPDTGYNTYDNNSTACTAANSRQVVSVASGYPIANVNQTEANTYCQSLGSSYHLITNNEWMTIARNAEQVTSNWSSGTVGSGQLARGFAAHTSYGDSWTNTKAAPSTSGNCLYNTGANACASTGTHLYKRTLALSNEAEIWDIPGNLWEWTNDTIECAAANCTSDEMPYGSSPASEWVEYASGATGWSGDVLSTYGSLTWDDMGPSDNSWNSDYGIGRLYTDADAAYPSGSACFPPRRLSVQVGLMPVRLHSV